MTMSHQKSEAANMNRCAHPHCTEPGLVRIEDNKWLCALHITMRVNLPQNVAMTEAMADRDEYEDDSGKLQ
jgi:hypothetical protein